MCSRCWASVYSARSLSYRHDHGIAEQQTSMAVVVQRMVDADASRRRDDDRPAHRRSHQDRRSRPSFGLGETVVGGTVTPDHFVVDKVMLEIAASRIAAKEIELVADCPRRVVERESRPTAGCSRRSRPRR